MPLLCAGGNEEDTTMASKPEQVAADAAAAMKAAQKVVRIGDTVPNFKADSTIGEFELHKYIEGSWAILFSHPADFTPVCTTELGSMATLSAEFKKRNVKVMAYSCDTAEDHKKWIGDINTIMNCKVDFPIIDGKDREVAIAFGMIDPDEKDAKGLPLTCRSLFIIDPSKTVKLILTYPASTGRNFHEVLRCVDSLQLAPKHKLATPADWKVGDKCVVLPGVSTEDAKKRYPKGVEEVKPWLRFTPQPDDEKATE